MRPIRSRSSESDAQAWRVRLCRTIINAVPLAFIGWLGVSLNKRIDDLTARIDKLSELLATDGKPCYRAPWEVGLGGALGPIRSRSNAAVSSCARK